MKNIDFEFGSLMTDDDIDIIEKTISDLIRKQLHEEIDKLQPVGYIAASKLTGGMISAVLKNAINEHAAAFLRIDEKGDAVIRLMLLAGWDGGDTRITFSLHDLAKEMIDNEYEEKPERKRIAKALRDIALLLDS